MGIVLQDVFKAFGEKVVLDGVSLEARDHETLAVIGPSGAGKSVLLKSIVGLLPPDAGSITVGELRLEDLDGDELVALRRDVGYVFQFAALFDSMTIADNVAMGLRRMRDMTEKSIDDRVHECLDLVELEELGPRYPSELSGGQRKRAGLARAIATKPRYLLYDEPTSGLDPVTGTVIDRLIIRMRDELNVTAVMVTHDMNSAYRSADRIAMLYAGRIRFVGTPDEFRGATDPVVRSFVEGRPELLETAV